MDGEDGDPSRTVSGVPFLIDSTEEREGFLLLLPMKVCGSKSANRK